VSRFLRQLLAWIIVEASVNSLGFVVSLRGGGGSALFGKKRTPELLVSSDLALSPVRVRALFEPTISGSLGGLGRSGEGHLARPASRFSTFWVI